jgi:hypothetical protein
MRISIRITAVPRRATCIPRVGARRVPNGIGGVAGCGVGVPVKALDSSCSGTSCCPGAAPNYPPVTGAV